MNDGHGTHTTTAELVDLLQAQAERIDRQQAEIDELRATLTQQPEAMASTTPVASTDAEPSTASSRRTVFKLAGAAAAGAAASVALGADRAAAHTDSVVKNGDNVTNTETSISMSSGPPLAGGGVLQVNDTGVVGTGRTSAIFGSATNTRAGNGVHGLVVNRGDGSNTGHAVVAQALSGSRSNIHMPPGGNAPTSDTFLHAAGELKVDSDVNLWFSTSSGIPGSWTRLAGPGVATPETLSNAVTIAFQLLTTTKLITPGRVYDSRLPMGSTPSGRLAIGQSRVIPTRDGRNIATGAVNSPNAVIASATGLLYTVSIITPSGSGFLAINPKEATEVNAATINFDSTSPTVLNNSSMVALGGDREIRVIAGGAAGGSVDFTIDVVGYIVDFQASGGLSGSLGKATEALARLET